MLARSFSYEQSVISRTKFLTRAPQHLYKSYRASIARRDKVVEQDAGRVPQGLLALVTRNVSSRLKLVLTLGSVEQERKRVCPEAKAMMGVFLWYVRGGP